MYESKGEATKTAITFNKGVKSVYIVDITENDERNVNLDSIELGRYEIVTLKVEF